MTQATCAFCGETVNGDQALIRLPFLIKSAKKAEIPLKSESDYVHVMVRRIVGFESESCMSTLGKSIRDKHHRAAYNRPPVQTKDGK